MQKVIVTGGAGFIGSNLSKTLIDEGFEVHIVDNLSSGKKENIPDGAVFHFGDIRHSKEITKIFKKISKKSPVEFVFHLAATPEIEVSKKSPFKTNETNVTGTDNVLHASYEIGVKRLIYSSSCSVYGNPTEFPTTENTRTSLESPYAFHKQIGELYCALAGQTSNLETVSLRYFNVYGPNQNFKSSYSGVISVFLHQRKNNIPITVTGDGTQTRDFVHVSDVARANILATQSKRVGKGEVINIGSGEESKIIDIAKIIGGPIEHISKRTETGRSRADIQKAKKLIEWTPKISIEKGLVELKKLHGIIN
jgi:UDP-glucose 4-epimerase